MKYYYSATEISKLKKKELLRVVKVLVHCFNLSLMKTNSSVAVPVNAVAQTGVQINSAVLEDLDVSALRTLIDSTNLGSPDLRLVNTPLGARKRNK